MDDKRLEFVAMILAGEEIKYLAPDAIRKRVREASAAYDIMVEELCGVDHAPAPRACSTCKYREKSICDRHCSGCCLDDGRPNWTPA